MSLERREREVARDEEEHLNQRGFQQRDHHAEEEARLGVDHREPRWSERHVAHRGVHDDHQEDAEGPVIVQKADACSFSQSTLPVGGFRRARAAPLGRLKLGTRRASRHMACVRSVEEAMIEIATGVRRPAREGWIALGYFGLCMGHDHPPDGPGYVACESWRTFGPHR